jgi:hypothetical protein
MTIKPLEVAPVYNWNDVKEELDRRLGYDIRNVSGASFDRDDDSFDQPYQDFWHFWLEFDQVSNGAIGIEIDVHEMARSQTKESMLKLADDLEEIGEKSGFVAAQTWRAYAEFAPQILQEMTKILPPGHIRFYHYW